MPSRQPNPAAVDVDTVGHILVRRHFDGPRGLELELWLASSQGPLRVRVRGQRAVMFVSRGSEARSDHRAARELESLNGGAVDALYFDRQADLVAERERLRGSQSLPYEADLRPEERFLMERFITASVRVRGPALRRGRVYELENPRIEASEAATPLSRLTFDIESDGLEGELFSIAGTSHGEARVFMRGDHPDESGESDEAVQEFEYRGQRAQVHYVPDEGTLLSRFFDWVEARDPDLLVGWNVIDFDLAALDRRCRALGLEFRLGRGGRRARLVAREAARGLGARHVARVPGRVVIDGIVGLRMATHQFESFSLANVAHALLGEDKAIDGELDALGEIRRMFAEDKLALARYNLVDCLLVDRILERTGLIEFLIERQRLTGQAMDRPGASMAAFDHLYLPRLHRAGFVAPSMHPATDGSLAPGGVVLESTPGLHRNILVFDFKSLYPSIIRSFCIDPLGLARPGDDPVPGFDGAEFARDGHILPGLIAELWRARDRAKARRDLASSQAIKILMNSFYGVLGASSCRFFDPRAASSITRRGHAIIRDSRTWFEERGHRVIYGDTDSLFVAVGDELAEAQCERTGRELAARLDAHWRERLALEFRLESQLELEFERHFLRFFMPTMRGSDRGSKKRYAGSVRSSDGGIELVIKGLEAVRSDWTRLARRFQRELFDRAFRDEDVVEYLRATVDALMAGELDAELVYRKGLRRDMDSYRRVVPPHVRAAQKLVAHGREPGRSVSYLMTTTGPEPCDEGGRALVGAVRLDHLHYLERQLAPAADGLLQVLGTSFEAIAGRQLTLF